MSTIEFGSVRLENAQGAGIGIDQKGNGAHFVWTGDYNSDGRGDVKVRFRLNELVLNGVVNEQTSEIYLRATLADGRKIKMVVPITIN